ncbi:MAG: hypothetical protein K2J40_09820 [Ruminococcus sp.]|nr:hypothetical protein [Ruminococcus sp.]
MKNFVKYMAFVLSLMTAAAVTGCEKQEAGDSTPSIAETTTTTIEEVTTTTSFEDVTEAVTEEITSEVTSEVSAEVNMDYRPVLDAYHQAYIDGNADAIYALFSPDEITAFDTYMKSYLRDNFGESDSTVEKMFAKDNIVSAINGSVQNIHGIMSDYNESDTDIWSINIDETTIERYTAEELSAINANLNINITDGYICEIPFYKNNTNDEIFVAEPASVLQIDGKWYISYSAACDRLIEFMDIEF